MGGDGVGHGTEHAHGCEAHHVVGDAQHDVGHLFHHVHQHVFLLVVQIAQRQAEEQREHQDLQHLVGRHGLDDVLREDVRDEILEVQRRGLQAQPVGADGQLHLQAMARLQQVGVEQAQEQRAERRRDEPAQGPAADAAHRLGVAHVGQARHQGGKHQGSDDHLDHAQEHIRQDAEIAGDLLGCLGRGGRGMHHVADEHPQCHCQQDHHGQAIGFHSFGFVCVVVLPGQAGFVSYQSPCGKGGAFRSPPLPHGLFPPRHSQPLAAAWTNLCTERASWRMRHKPLICLCHAYFCAYFATLGLRISGRTPPHPSGNPNAACLAPAASCLRDCPYQAAVSSRTHCGRSVALCCRKSTQITVAPPAAQTTPGASSFSMVIQLSKVVRAGSLTYSLSLTTSG